MGFHARLRELGYELPGVAKPLASYVPAVRVGNQVWTSGQLPLALEVGHDVFWVRARGDGNQFPAVFTPRIEDLLRSVGKNRCGCVFPFSHGSILTIKYAPRRLNS